MVSLYFGPIVHTRCSNQDAMYVLSQCVDFAMQVQYYYHIEIQYQLDPAIILYWGLELRRLKEDGFLYNILILKIYIIIIL